MTQIEIIKALSDNYIYVLHNPINKQTAVIDPGEAQPVIELLEKKGWNFIFIFSYKLSSVLKTTVCKTVKYFFWV